MRGRTHARHLRAVVVLVLSGMLTTLTGQGAVQVAFGGGTWMTGAHKDVKQLFSAAGFGGTEPGWLFSGSATYPTSSISRMTWFVEGMYAWSTHVRLGLMVQSIPLQSVRGIDGEREQIKGEPGYGVFLSYVPYVVDPVHIQAPNNQEVFAGVGVCLRSMTVEGDLGGDSPGFSIARRLVGLQARAGTEFYFPRQWSLQVRVEATWLPAIKVPAQSYESKALPAHEVKLSGVYFSVGLKFRRQVLP